VDAENNFQAIAKALHIMSTNAALHCFVGTKQNIVFTIILVLILKGSTVQGRPPLSMEHNQLQFPACSQTVVQTSQTQSHHPQSE